VLAFQQMSNHLHLVVEDRAGRLSEFMCFFLSRLAQDINRIDRTRGPVFEARFRPTEIIDQPSLERAIAYALSNPVKARLVLDHRQWPGLQLLAGSERHAGGSFSHPIPTRHHARGVWTETLELPACTSIDLERINLLVAEMKGAAIRGARTPVLGAQSAARLNPFSAPKPTAQTPMPLCHAESRSGWLAYREAWRAFLRSYRRASSLLRQGVADVQFPDHCFRPGMPAAIRSG
jgi:hypothetical protein